MPGNIIVVVVAIIALAFGVDVWRNRARQGSTAPQPAPDRMPFEPPPPKAALLLDVAGRVATPVEKWTIGLLACAALLTFFFPLLSLRVPIVGEHDVTGYDVVSKIGQFSQQVASPGSSERTTGTPQPARSEDTLRGMPISVRTAPLIALFIMGAFACALLTLLGVFFSIGTSRVASTVGALLGIAAVVHIRVMNSDLHRMLQQVMDRQAQELKDNPFAALGQALGSLMVNAFQVRPGAGLYVLMLALAVASVLVHSKILTRLRLAEAQ